METSKRGQWGSSFGFLMAAIGSAIGLGNLWAFPYIMGKTGGFAFLILYLILVALVGVVGMLGEFALGRKTGKGAGGAYAALGKKYSFIGWMAVISPFLILSFYAVLGGMVLRYCLGFLVQIFGADGFAGQGSGFFGWLLYSGQSMLLFFALFRLIAGQEHFALDIDQRCCHNKELTHHIHIFRLHLPDISHVLIRNQYNRNIINIYFVFFDQMQEQIQRALKYLQFYR